jgi:hypothetical protein
MGMRVASDRHWIAAVDHDVSLGVADEKERHGHLETPETERPAREQVQRKTARHDAILGRHLSTARTPRPPAHGQQLAAGCWPLAAQIVQTRVAMADERCCK